MNTDRVVVIGAGIGGLAAAIELSACGLPVLVLERAEAVGGKMRQVVAGGVGIDAGPTVLTLRGVFEALFARAGTTLEAALTVRPAERLARHAWRDGSRLDLFADIGRSADAIGVFAGRAAAQGYREFCARSARIFATLEPSFIAASRPSLPGLVARAGPRALAGISPFSTLWQALGAHFEDPRLRQLFGRYATYCGSSPFSAPATLMLVAHVEQSGVWLVEGGMHGLARALADAARALGATIRTEAAVERIEVAGGRVGGVVLAGGERVAAGAVICNADAAALAAGLFGETAKAGVPTAARSLSAVTWATRTPTRGIGLVRHNVFFSDAYRAEFEAIFERRMLPEQPTVYVCAQDRDDSGRGVPQGESGGEPERLLILVNAPAVGDDGLSAGGDAGRPTPKEITQCRTTMLAQLRQCGLTLDLPEDSTRLTGPAEFAQLFPGTGGALYGPASHGWAASFRRPGSRTTVPGLYLAGGSTHPGPGVPMAAISGRLAASALMADRASTSRSRMTAIAGGMSTR